MLKEQVESHAVNMAQLKNVRYVTLHFTDLLGMLRGRAVPVDMVEQVLHKGMGFDGSSIRGFVGIEDSDMVMKPDPATLVTFPTYFYGRPTANFICNIESPGGEPYESDPRFICKSVVERIHQQGYEPLASAELEFYLAKKEGDGLFQPVESHVKDEHRYLDVMPGREVTQAYRMDLCDALASMGIVVERELHEVGSAQNEITFKYSTPVTTSDNIMRYKFAAKAVATQKYGWIATFMPKPWHGMPGNGMHVHVDLAYKNGKGNVFYDPDEHGGLSQFCLYFLGGLLEHARALCAVVAPTVNSYKRLVPGYEAPVYVAWSKRNRSALVRVPGYFPGNSEEIRLEFRCPDPLCNPYLAYAVIFEAGMDGVRKKISPPEPVRQNVYHFSDAQLRELGIKTLPKSLREALDEWNSDDICVKALGKENAEKFLELKTTEWKEYISHVSADTDKVTTWEIERYFLT